MDGATARVLVPYDEARHQLGGIGRTRFYQLIDERKLVRVNIGRRGFVTAESIRLYVDSLAAASA